MTSEESFLRAMREDPDDLDLRLVFADWLEEPGDLRAELVRLSVQLVQAQDEPRRIDKLYQQILERQELDRVAWLGPLAERVKVLNVRRGLLDLFATLEDLEEWRAIPGAARYLAWVETLSFRGTGQDVIA